LLEQGRVDDLYSPAAQQEVQLELFGDEDDGYMAFAYMPHVAAVYTPLAALDYRTSYAVHSLLMVAAFVASLWLLRPRIGLLHSHFPVVLAASLLSVPMFMAIGGGQNTAITMLLFATVWRAIGDDNEWLAGLAGALLLFRPQYAIPLMGLLLLGRYWRAVGWAAAGTALTWLANAAILGTDWVTTWLDGVAPFLDETADANSANAISLLGVARAVFGYDSTVATLVGGSGALVVVGALCWLWVKPHDLDTRMAITAVGVLLLSPHALFYDAGLLTFTLLVLADRRLVSMRTVGAIWLIAALHPLKELAGVTPVAVATVATFVIAWRALVTDSPATDQDRVLPIQESYSPL
jgi:hypothetical protein